MVRDVQSVVRDGVKCGESGSSMVKVDKVW